jgi:predicted XRE-type DNA-binding protein
MPSAKETNEPGHITTGNVLEDLGFSAEEIHEMEIKYELWVPIRAQIDARKLTQAKLATELQIHQPDASLLLRGQLSRFSITRLMQFADRLQLRVTLAVVPSSEAHKPQSPARIPLRKAKPRKQAVRPSIARKAARKAVLA